MHHTLQQGPWHYHPEYLLGKAECRLQSKILLRQYIEERPMLTMGEKYPEHESVVGFGVITRDTDIFVHVKGHNILESV